ncbi:MULTISPECIES: hypothetical protein [Mycobacteroides]|uniref:hypothetical protein n=1 Tax=Mycobacteroides TaxID=670516 RepID=UPI000712785F|nr:MULTISPECIES: hypothetical protein [Mycobacteroides]KRQ24273.1 hypothetical protein AOT91_22515 [Mycobacteroides sp. H092]KRQ25988.1 hypothetical protein AOT87_07475 [Mycobacteroides sp. H003]KRQ39316.1 hypothetical protein AOT92_18665 [Mycobacteroides sp. H101]KRQ48693.1 hypothetical protein AOT88_13475 [Mycobacteroides sp. H063]KRQ58759.1 hypothetical protein AOT94_10915 [Mycobacteroides sp. HXVII]
MKYSVREGVSCIAAAVALVVWAPGIGLGASAISRVNLAIGPMSGGAATSSLQGRLGAVPADNSGNGNPDSDVSGPYDRDSNNVAPPPPSSGTGMECEDAGVTCIHDQSGTALTSDNDEV